jgi:hypothetical protein
MELEKLLRRVAFPYVLVAVVAVIVSIIATTTAAE